MPLFEVAIIEVKPKKKDEEDSRPRERLVFGPAAVIATDPQNAAIRAVLDNASQVADVDKDRMQVLVRPFA